MFNFGKELFYTLAAHAALELCFNCAVHGWPAIAHVVGFFQ